MITMTYAEAFSPNLPRACKKLQDARLSIKEAYQVKKIMEILERQRKFIHVQWGLFQTKISETKELEDNRKQEEAKWGETTFTIDKEKIPFTTIEKVHDLTASDLAALSPLFSEPETKEPPASQ